MTYLIYKWLCFVIGNVVLLLSLIVLFGKVYDLLSPVRRQLLGKIKRTYPYQWIEYRINWPKVKRKIKAKEDNYEKETWLNDLKEFVTENVRMKTNKYQSLYLADIERMLLDYRTANNLV